MKKIITVFFSTSISLLILEAFLRILSVYKLIYPIEMTKYAILLKRDHPQMGHVHIPNKQAKLMGVPVQINSDGFRDYEHKIDKSGKYRIIFLGDSITFGWGVKVENTFKYITEKELNKTKEVEIINMGIGNYNSEQQADLFFNKGIKYSPDKIIMFYFINDAEKKQLYLTSLFNYSYLSVITKTKLSLMIPNLNDKKDFIKYYSGLYTDNDGWKNAKNSILRLAEYCKKNNIYFQIIILPDLHNLIDYPFTKEHQTISEFLTNNNIDHLDITPNFHNWSNHKDLWVSNEDAHPNSLGHELIAKYSLDFIKKDIIND